MKVTIFQDTYCPWCYLGKKSLETAIDDFDGKVEIEYKSFFLNPNLPDSGVSKEEYLKGRYDSKQFDEMNQVLKDRANKAGIEMNLDYDHIPNSLLSHRLGKLYPDKKAELIEAYYQAYFRDNVDIGDINVLMGIAEDLDIDTTEAKYKLLKTDEKRDEVFEDYKTAQKIGVRGVPFFIFNNEQAIQGAHEPEMLLQVMRRISARESISLDMNR